MKMFPVPCFNRVEKIEKYHPPIYEGSYSVTISGTVDEWGNVEIFKPFDTNIQPVIYDGTTNIYSYYNTVGIDSANWAE